MTTSLSATTAEQFALAGVESFVLRRAVAAGILRIFGFDRQFDEAAAQALHLLFCGRAHVVGGGNRAQPSRGGNRLQTRQRRRRSQKTRAGVMVPAAVVIMGKILMGGVCCEQDGFIPADRFPWRKARPCSGRGWCGASVQRKMRLRRCRQSACTTSREPSGRRNPIRHLPATQKRKVGFAGHVVRAIARTCTTMSARRKQRRGRERSSRLFRRRRRRDSPASPRQSLRSDFQARFGEIGNDGRNQRDPLFPGKLSFGTPTITMLSSRFFSRPRRLIRTLYGAQFQSDLFYTGQRIFPLEDEKFPRVSHDDLDEARATAIMEIESNLMTSPAGGLAA